MKELFVKHENETLINPMAIDSEEDLNDKKEKWMDIFDRHPDLSDLIIFLYRDLGDENIDRLETFISENFGEWYDKAFKNIDDKE